MKAMKAMKATVQPQREYERLIAHRRQMEKEHERRDRTMALQAQLDADLEGDEGPKAAKKAAPPAPKAMKAMKKKGPMKAMKAMRAQKATLSGVEVQAEKVSCRVQ